MPEYIFPLKKWSGYGYKFNDRTWYSLHHLGVDFIVPIGTPVYAVMDGVINNRKGIQAGLQIWQEGSSGDMYGHSGKIIARYMHLSAFANTSGKFVKQGSLIGYSGNSGVLTKGAHLHFDLMINDKYVDPLLYLSDVPDIIDEPDLQVPCSAMLTFYSENEIIRKDEKIYTKKGTKQFYQIPSPDILKKYNSNEIIKCGKQIFTKPGIPKKW